MTRALRARLPLIRPFGAPSPTRGEGKKAISTTIANLLLGVGGDAGADDGAGDRADERDGDRGDRADRGALGDGGAEGGVGGALAGVFGEDAGGVEVGVGGGAPVGGGLGLLRAASGTEVRAGFEVMPAGLAI